MIENTQKDVITELSQLILIATERQTLRKAVFSKPNDKSLQKTVITLREVGGKRFLQAEYFHKDNKVTHRNISIDDNAQNVLAQMCEDYAQINLLTADGDCE